MKLTRIFPMFLFVALLVTACQSEGIEVDIFNHLEQTAEYENSLHNYREKMVEVESEESEIYQELIETPTKDLELIESLIDQAKSTIKDRQSLLEQEREEMDLSREEFLLVEPLFGQIEDEKLRESAELMHKTMTERYHVYDKWYDLYQDRLELENEFYELFQGEEIDYELVNEKVEALNHIYEEANQIHEEFSELTRKYNEEKMEFYQLSPLEIEFKE